MAQVAISCVLLAAAVLFSRSLQTLTNLDAGFRPENVLLLNAYTLKAGPQGVERVRLYETALERLSRVPGVGRRPFRAKPCLAAAPGRSR